MICAGSAVRAACILPALIGIAHEAPLLRLLKFLVAKGAAEA